MIEPIPANSLHEKHLPPHLRRRRSGTGTSVTYYNAALAADTRIEQAVAGEQLVKGTFGYFSDDKVFTAGVNIEAPASCYILDDANADEIVNVVLGGYVVNLDGVNIDTVPFLGYSGAVAATPPSGAFEQVLGLPINESTFYLQFRPPVWEE